MLSVLFIVLSCICIAVGRYQIRRARRMPGRRWLRRTFGWGAVSVGFALMVLGVISWGLLAR